MGEKKGGEREEAKQFKVPQKSVFVEERKKSTKQIQQQKNEKKSKRKKK